MIAEGSVGVFRVCSEERTQQVHRHHSRVEVAWGQGRGRRRRVLVKDGGARAGEMQNGPKQSVSNKLPESAND